MTLVMVLMWAVIIQVGRKICSRRSLGDPSAVTFRPTREKHRFQTKFDQLLRGRLLPDFHIHHKILLWKVGAASLE